MGEYKLSAVLSGHSSDVRAVALPDPNFAITASRDGTTKTWKRTSTNPPSYESTESSHSAAYKTSVAFVPPTKEYGAGLIISGGQDAIIEARQPSSTSESNADGLMVGHSNQISSLDVNVDEGWIVSGSWDGTAKLWRIGQWEPEVEFSGHQGTVWAVLAYSNEFVVTGCADQGIRVFDIRAKAMAEFSAKDVCRALAKIPEGNRSGGQLLSASNDSVIRVWSLKGELISELHGHEAFIYSLAVLPDGRFVSSGEDRTVRIWRDSSCVQTITLPAVSVWSVATCSNGDIIAGSSDKMARIFTTDPDRMADDAVQAEFTEAVKSSSIPQQTIGAINKTDMEGPEFLQRKSGTKDGQVQMIKENDGSVSAYSWSIAKQSWDMVGTVVDSVGSGHKVNYKGKEYDYVFDVDIEDGKPALKLPYNVTQNPHEAATRWLQDQGLPLTYLEETANFIVQNVQGASLGPSSSEPAGPDPMGTESRYRPGATSSYQPSRPAASAPAKKLPQKEYVSIVAGKPEAAYQQILKLNTRSIDLGESASILSEAEVASLAEISRQLQAHKFDGKSFIRKTPALEACLSVVIRIATQWQPPSNRLAGLDLLRFLAAASSDFPDFEVQGEDIVTLIVKSGVFDSDLVATNAKLAMVAIRLFSNLMFGSGKGRDLLEAQSDLVVGNIRTMTPYCSKDPFLSIAVTTFYLNLAVWITHPDNAQLVDREDRALTIIEEISHILGPLPAVNDKASGGVLQQLTEPVYRGLFAVGTFLTAMGSPDLKDAARNIFNIDTMLSQLKERGYLREPRFQGLVEEVRDSLK